MNYNLLNKILLSNITKYFPKTINRKIFRKFNIFFVPTILKNLPSNFYPLNTDISKQNDLILQFNCQKKLINQTTYSSLDKLLIKIFKKKSFSFFDIGGDNIDLYLYLNSKLNIKKYYISNFHKLILIFEQLKRKYNFYNFFPITSDKKISSLDFVYFGSCIQYFKNYKTYLNSILSKKPKYILFSGTSFFLMILTKAK